MSKIHNFTCLIGYSAQKNRNYTNLLGSMAGTFSNNLIPNLSASSNVYGNTYSSMNTLLSSFFRFNYDFMKTYLVSFAFRRDGSSKFGSNSKFANFPSISAAWRLTELNFMKNLNLVNELKIRASYGVTGNNNIGDFAAVANVVPDNYVFGSGTNSVAFGLAPNGFSNPNLTWETNTQKNLGLDISILKRRISITCDVYERITNGLLTSTPIAALGGFSTTYLRNIGTIRNRGIEIAINTKNTTGVVKWNTDFNFSMNRNKIIDYYKNDPDYFNSVFGWNSTFQVKKGGSVGDIYGLISDGVFMNQKEVDAGAQWYSGGSKPGDIKYRDVDGNGIINNNDRAVIANVFPKYVIGVNNTLSYQSFDFRMLIQCVNGSNIIYATGRLIDASVSGQANATTDILNRWKSESHPGDGKTPRVTNAGNSNDFSSRFVRDASFVRLRSMSIGYTLSTATCKTLSLQSARLYVSGFNLFTISDYIGYNPETNTEGASVVRPNIDQGSYPLPKSVAVGINVDF